MGMTQEQAKKIAEAKTSNFGNKIKDGEGTLVVKRIICQEKYKGTYFIPEFDVVESRKTHETIEPNAAGSDCSCAWDVGGSGKKGDAARGNIKQFVTALLGLDDSADLMTTILAISGDPGTKESLLTRGMLIDYTTKRKTIESGENKGKEMLIPVFTRRVQTTDQVKERAKHLDELKR